jgi:hypothetical protein
MSKEMAMRVGFAAFALRKPGGLAGRLCPDQRCDLWTEEKGPHRVVGVCLAEDSGVGCPKLRVPRDALLTAGTEETK